MGKIVEFLANIIGFLVGLVKIADLIDFIFDKNPYFLHEKELFNLKYLDSR